MHSVTGEGTEGCGLTQKATSLRRPVGSKGNVGDAVTCTDPLTIVVAMTSIADTATRARSMAGPPVSTETLELVAVSPWCDGPPTVLRSLLHRKLRKMLPPR